MADDRAPHRGQSTGRGVAGMTLFVGLGRMGQPMVRRYAGTHSTVLFDIDTAISAGLAAELGAVALPELTGLPDDIATVILMLPTAGSSSRSCSVTDGLLARLSPGTLVIDMGPRSRRARDGWPSSPRERGLRYVDAPVSGGVAKATTGELSIMVGGEPAAVQSAMPHLEPMGNEHRARRPGRGRACGEGAEQPAVRHQPRRCGRGALRRTAIRHPARARWSRCSTPPPGGARRPR